MPVDPIALTPSAGAGLPVSAKATADLARPVGVNCKGGSLPAALTFVDYSHHQATRAGHARSQSALLALGGHVAVFGDSQIELMPVQEISPYAVNYGIGGDTIAGLVHRLRGSDGGAEYANYAALANASAVVLASIPFNDICVASPSLGTIQSQYATLMSYFTGPMVIIPPPPNTTTSAWNSNLTSFNSWLSSTYGARAQTAIVSVSDITTGVLADGQHHNGATSLLLARRAKAALRTLA